MLFIIKMSPTLDFYFQEYETTATYYYKYATDTLSIFNNYLIQNKGAYYMLMFWFTTFIIYYTFSNGNKRVLEEEIKNIERSCKVISSALSKSNTKSANLILENNTLTEQKTELESKLFEAHKEIRKLNYSINKLKERNAILCDSLGEFIMNKRRKLNDNKIQHTYNLRPRKEINYNEMIDSDTSEENQQSEQTHNYNLRQIEPISYANMDVKTDDKNDSDYHPETK
jgi:hypothetical protein